MNKIYCGAILLAAIIGSFQLIKPWERHHKRAKQSYKFQVTPYVGQKFIVLYSEKPQVEKIDFDSKKSSKNIRLDGIGASTEKPITKIWFTFEALKAGDAKLVFSFVGPKGKSYRETTVKIVE
jgi:hypothetical protein